MNQSINFDANFDASVSVLVLLAIFNGEKYLREQLDSIFEQRHVHISLIFSDDGSSDSSLEILEEYVALHPGKILSFKSCRKAGRASLNFLRMFADVEFTGFDYVALADQDDVWEDTKLARAVFALRKSGCAGYSSAVTAFWPDGSTVYLGQMSKPTGADYLFEGAGQGCTFLVSADLAGLVKDVVSTYWAQLSYIHYHDWLIYAIARCMRLQWYFDPVSSMQYRQHGSNDTGARGSIKGLIKRLKMIRSGWYGIQVKEISCISGKIAPSNLEINAFNKLIVFSSSVKMVGKLKLLNFLAINGRRRLSDRVALCIMGFFGYLDKK